jgi:hypothetical protein
MLEDLGNIGDFVGGIAVVVTLLYLAIQVRQNTAALRTASRQEVVSGFRDFNRLSFDPDVVSATSSGALLYPDMENPERTIFSALMNDHALFFQGAYALYEAGTLEEETYQAYLQFFSMSVCTPGGSNWWTKISPLYMQRMVSAVNEHISLGGVPDLFPLFESRDSKNAEQVKADGEA